MLDTTTVGDCSGWVTVGMDDREHWAESTHRLQASWPGTSAGANDDRRACAINAHAVIHTKILSESEILRTSSLCREIMFCTG